MEGGPPQIETSRIGNIRLRSSGPGTIMAVSSRLPRRFQGPAVTEQKRNAAERVIATATHEQNLTLPDSVPDWE